MQTFLIFVAGFALLQALAELIARDKTTRHYMAAGFYLCIGIIILHMSGRHGTFFDENQEWFGWSLPFVVWSGPFLYYYLGFNLDLYSIDIGRFILELLPGVAVCVILLVTHPSFGGLLFSSVDEMLQAPNLYTGVLLGSFIFNGWFIYRFIRALRQATGSLRTVSSMIVPAIKYYLAFVALAMVVILAAFLADSRLILNVTHILLVGQILVPYLYFRRNPEMLDDWLERLKKEKYRISQIGSVNKDALLARLNHLMNNELIYQDDELSLNSLAARLSLTRHQLSEYFNSYLQTSFVEYINSRRVKAAEELLLETEMTVLRIGLEVGFSSKSSFNRSFRKHTGLTPTDYRIKNSKN